LHPSWNWTEGPLPGAYQLPRPAPASGWVFGVGKHRFRKGATVYEQRYAGRAWPAPEEAAAQVAGLAEGRRWPRRDGDGATTGGMMGVSGAAGLVVVGEMTAEGPCVRQFS
jgi:hypothetical protein